jgi:hypothetical protein
MKTRTGWAGHQTKTETSGEDSGGVRSVFVYPLNKPHP